MYPNSHQEKHIIEYYILYIISVYAFGNMQGRIQDFVKGGA